MTLKNKLELLTKEWNALSAKIKEKLSQKDKTITETNQKLQESNRNLETTLKESAENEKVLEKLIKEFKELSEQLK